MLKFDNDHIVTGYIKQLLSTYDLPNCKVYNESTPLFKNTIYLKDNYFQMYTEEKEWKNLGLEYVEGTSTKNLTKHLKITNNRYDTYTHEYLGEYLRFKRDYKGINLMSLYNCFSNKICSNLKLSFNIASNGNETKYTFDSSSDSYKIFMFPVKLNKKYTIAINCSKQVEMFCELYDNYLLNVDKEKEKDKNNQTLPVCALSYDIKANTSFSAPFLYDCLDFSQQSGIKIFNALQKKGYTDKYLKLFIKVPIEHNASIVVLEGDYTKYLIGNKCKIDTTYLTDSDHNYTDLLKNNLLVSPLSLLYLSDTKSYPFADALISYLVGNMITAEDENPDNIKRIQQVMDAKYTLLNSRYKFDGIWEDRMQCDIYNTLINDKINELKPRLDVLGYVDNTAEQNYQSLSSIKSTIANADIYK